MVNAKRGIYNNSNKMYFKKGKAKIEIAVAKGKKQYDKRQALKRKDWNVTKPDI